MLFYRKDRAKRVVSAHKVIDALPAEVADRDELHHRFTKNGAIVRIFLNKKASGKHTQLGVVVNSFLWSFSRFFC